MANFNSLLKQLHGGLSEGPVATEMDNYITIDSSRRFILPEGFNTTIAYEGDVNSQIVTFKCPKMHEGHDLSKCESKRLRWVNEGSANEGNSILASEVTEDGHLLLKWEVPPEAFTHGGMLRISITLADYVDGKLAFAWNTATLDKLSVGTTLDSVSEQINQEGFDNYIPSKSEILTINAETRQILAPADYNHTLCNYGDVGTSVVYFQLKRYIRGIDVLDENTNINVHWRLKDMSNVDKGSNGISGNNRRLRALELDGRDSEGLVTIMWTPSQSITANSLGYAGEITIQLEIVSADGRIWRTNAYPKLKIGKDAFPITTSDLPVEESNVTNYVVDGAVVTPDKKTETIAGLVKLRRCTAEQPIFVHKNELVIEYDNDGNYVGAKIGVIEPQDSRQAPYVAYTPSMTILLDGGNASGE